MALITRRLWDARVASRIESPFEVVARDYEGAGYGSLCQALLEQADVNQECAGFHRCESFARREAM